MTDATSMQQFEQGLRTIHSGIIAALGQKGLRNVSVSHARQWSGPRDATFTVTANGTAESLMFTREEIVDSARDIDSFANTKVRMLVSRFAA